MVYINPFYQRDLDLRGYEQVTDTVYLKGNHMIRLVKVHMNCDGTYEFLRVESYIGHVLDEHVKAFKNPYRKIEQIANQFKQTRTRLIKCLVCSAMIDITASNYDRHHVTYYPELIIPLHRQCHTDVTMGRMPILKPPKLQADKFYRKELRSLPKNILVNRHIKNKPMSRTNEKTKPFDSRHDPRREIDNDWKYKKGYYF